MIISDTQQKIIDAFLMVAEKSDHAQDVTMLKVATTVGMTPQSIYRKHFSSVHDITITIRKKIISEILDGMTEAHEEDPTLSPFTIVAEEVIPIMYSYRFAINVFYRHMLDPEWVAVMADPFVKWVQPFLKKDTPTEREASALIVRIVIDILLQWITAEPPLPPSIFKDKFLRICTIFHLADYVQMI